MQPHHWPYSLGAVAGWRRQFGAWSLQTCRQCLTMLEMERTILPRELPSAFSDTVSLRAVLKH